MSQITTLGKYHILERLAADWMSEIYRVKTIGIAGFEKVQALKKILAEHSSDPVFFRTFIEQAKEAFSLNHRNIVQVFEFGKTGEDLFLAMEHIPGLNLGGMIRLARASGRGVPVGLTCYIMGEVAAGLEYAHRKTDHHGRELGVVHCLVTPDNIACSFEGSVKILDFGLSRTAWLMAPRGDIFPGEARYLSPEQVRGEDLDARSDLFSFGVILWELLAGAPLFNEESRSALFRRMLQDAIPSPRTINPDIPAELEELTLSCLAREPYHRTNNASVLQAQLHRIQRQLGAVIGSRALSTFLEDLFPVHSDHHDARQSESGGTDSGPALAPGGAAMSPPPGLAEDSFDDLFLDRPGTLFPDETPASGAVASVEPAPEQPAAPQYLQTPSPAPAPIPKPETVGVLRTGRPEDEDLSAVHAEPPETLEASTLDLIEAPQLYTDDGTTGALTGTLDSDEISIVDLGDAELEDDHSRSEPTAAASAPLPDPEGSGPWDPVDLDEPTADLLDQWGAPDMDITAPPAEDPGPPSPLAHAETGTNELENVTPLNPGHADGLDIASADITMPMRELTPQPGAPEAQAQALQDRPTEPPELSEVPTAPRQGDRAHGDDGLPQKKRFIAVSLLLEGPPAAAAEAAALIADMAYKVDGLIHEQDPGAGRILVLFGLPTADELDIVSAARFALDCKEAVDSLAASPRATQLDATLLTVRIGVKAGTARSARRDAGWSQGFQLLGNIQRAVGDLPRRGGPGQILLAGLAARLARPHYALRTLTTASGPTGAPPTHLLLGPHPSEGQRQSRPGSLMVGREVEIQAIKSTWRESMVQSQQCAALVIGEAGIGKTRLVDHFLGFFAQDVLLLAARATPHRRLTPNAVLVDLLHAATGMGRPRGGSLHSRLTTSLHHLLGDPDDDHAAEALLSLVRPSGERMQQGAPSQEGTVNPLRLQRALRKLLNRLAWDRPVVVIIEDLHWADTSSLEALTGLVERPDEATGPCFFLLTSRPEESPVMQALISADGVNPVLLDELDEQDRRRLIAEALGEERASDALVEEVAYRAGGNPFYIRELTRALAELEADELAEVPATVQRVVAGRVDRLPVQVKNVLQHAAVIGATFREPILARLLGRNPARALATLRNLGLIVPGMLTVMRHKSSTGDGEQYEREWAFRNILLREVVYEDIGLATRRRLHLKVGQIMARRVGEGSSDRFADVALHLEQGGERAVAGGFYQRAADEASAAYPSPEALRLYDAALQLAGDDQEQRHAALSGRERIHRQLGWSHRQAEDLEALGDLAGDDPARISDLRNREANYLLRRGEALRALSAAEQAERAAAQCGDDLARGEALRLKGDAYQRLNDHRRAVSAAEGALELFRGQRSVHDQVRALTSLGCISLDRARYEEASGHFEAALDLLKSAEDRWRERILRYFTAVIHYCRGYLPQALGEALYSLKLCEQYGDRAREGDNSTVVGIIYLELGQLEHARAYLEAALTIHRETRSRWSEADTLVYLGLLEATCGEYERALEVLSGTREIAEEISARSITIGARNAVAWVLCERGEAEDPADAAEEALAAAEEARLLGIIVGEIPGLSRAARAYAARGRMDEALSLSRRAVELLGDQGFIETPEEEVFFGHFRILAAMGDPGADRWLARARQALELKLGRLEDGEWRQAFSTRVPLNRAILER